MGSHLGGHSAWPCGLSRQVSVSPSPAGDASGIFSSGGQPSDLMISPAPGPSLAASSSLLARLCSPYTSPLNSFLWGSLHHPRGVPKTDSLSLLLWWYHKSSCFFLCFIILSGSLGSRAFPFHLLLGFLYSGFFFMFGMSQRRVLARQLREFGRNCRRSWGKSCRSSRETDIIYVSPLVTACVWLFDIFEFTWCF